MVLPVAPGFQLGDQVRLADGRGGEITAIRPNDDEGFWEYLVSPIFEFFPEFDLTLGTADAAPPGEVAFDDLEPVVLTEPAPTGEFVTHDEMRQFVVDLINLQGPGGITQSDLDNATQTILNAANLSAQANLLAHVDQTATAMEDVRLFAEARFQELESSVTTGLSKIEKRSTELETAAEESSGFGFLGFVGGLGGLLKDPANWIMTRLEEFIINEVHDGLSR